MTITASVAPSPHPTRLRLRLSIGKLSAAELATFREAITKALTLGDDRGYEFFANWHGVTFGYCEHHNEWFLPWHRQYLYYFEQALQRQVPSVTLPWWDWTTTDHIPTAYSDATDAAGHPNVLAKAPVRPWTGSQTPPAPAETSRRPGAAPRSPGPPYSAYMPYVMAAPTYTEFNQRIWQIHDAVHVWVGGTMSDPAWAAFDPLFWAHHTMVDRVWRIWQHNHPGALPPANILDRGLRPNGMTVKQTLDVKQLGYDYAATTASSRGTK
jgi:tyrosinase